MAPVALDADVLIAFLDASDAQHESAVDALRPRLATGQQLLIAASVYAEILVRPIQRGSDHAVDAFIDAISATIVPIDRVIVRRAAQMRGAHRALRLPDAISLATALVGGAEYVTLDRRLRKIAEVERTAEAGSDSSAVRPALRESAARRRRRSALRREAEQAALDDRDLAASREALADMEALSPDWPPD